MTANTVTPQEFVTNPPPVAVSQAPTSCMFCGFSRKNAPLLNAAPDMLAALVRAARCLEALDGSETAADLRDIFDQAAAAIAKAEGRS